MAKSEIKKFHFTLLNEKVRYIEKTHKILKNMLNVSPKPSIKNKQFDLIISNILAVPLIDLAPLICSLLSKTGRLIISGFLDYQTDEVIDSYVRNRIEVQKISKD